MLALKGETDGGVTTLVLARLPKETAHERCVGCPELATHEGYGLRRGQIFRLPLCDTHTRAFDEYDGPLAKVTLEAKREKPKRWISCGEAKKLLGISQPQLWRWATENGVAKKDGFYDEQAIKKEAKRRASQDVTQRVTATRRRMAAKVAEAAGPDWMPPWEARTLLGLSIGGFWCWMKRCGVTKKPGLIWKADVMAELERRREKSKRRRERV